MKRYLKILLGIVWLICLTALIIALTNILPHNSLKDFQWYILFAFVLVTGLMKEYLI